jgi:DMSO reductase family type II enzyme heme b subunit
LPVTLVEKALTLPSPSRERENNGPFFIGLITLVEELKFMKHVLNSRGLLAGLLLLLVVGCGKPAPAPAPPPQEVAIVPVGALTTDPDDAAWNQAPEFVGKLLPQDMVEPRQLKPTTPEVRIRALGSGDSAAFRIEWIDAAANDAPGPSQFCDACAVQTPAKVEPTLPAPQMGETGKRVEITYWNAAWQAMVNGREDNIKALYPNAAVDHYPFESQALQKDSTEQKEMASRYSPARALGNRMSGPRTTPVQDLIAEGPGTITPAAETISKGAGKRTSTGWAVVLIHRLPEGFSAASGGSQVAFAVWDGASEEVGARKMRTIWIPLVKRAK